MATRGRLPKDTLPPRPERPFTVVRKPSAGRVILVDGANVAHEMHRNDQPQLRNLWLVEGALAAAGYKPLLIIDANLRWKLNRDDAKALERRRDEIVQAPAGVPADRALLEYAHRKDLAIVTNDRFREFEADYPWIRDAGRRIPYNIIGDEVLFYFPRPDERRGGRRAAAPKAAPARTPRARMRSASPRTREPGRSRTTRPADAPATTQRRVRSRAPLGPVDGATTTE